MEQIFIIETYIDELNLKIQKTEEQLRAEEAYKAAMEAALRAIPEPKGKKGKKAKKPPKAKKGKKGKAAPVPVGPSEEEIKQYLATCSVTMECIPIFNFYLSYDRFIPPPPEPPPVVEKKGKKGKKGGKGGKGGGKAKGKKGKKGKAPPGPEPYKIVIPPDPVPSPPAYCIGQSVVFNSRPKRLLELMKTTPIKISIWNREPEMDCVGFVNLDWDASFIQTLERACVEFDQHLEEKYRDNRKRKILTTSIEIRRELKCEEDLTPSGDVKIYIRLTCLGSRTQSTFINLPEMPMIKGKSFLKDADNTKSMEVERDWEFDTIYDYVPVAYLYCAPEITLQALREEEVEVKYDDYKAPFTDSELAIITMGIPKGRCGGINCPKRLETCLSTEEFIPSTPAQRGKFVNANDVKGPCGRIDCPLAIKVRDYIENSLPYKPCERPCLEEEKS